ncbi:MAG: hypothetical protein IT393_06800 [Nitrospirae bacterium]|nr:hypothetical protein [Nitrospirota bacterium]
MIEADKGGDITEPQKVQINETYGKLPLYFIQNNGQVNEKVNFYERGNGHATFFTKEGVSISLVHSGKQDVVSKKAEILPPVSTKNEVMKQIPSPLAGAGQGEGNSTDIVNLTFLNANPNPEIIAVDPQEGKVNYFIGNDPKKWKTSIPTYKAVLYKEVYTGIDIKFYGNNRQMEYDIIVKAGADSSKVQFAYNGIKGLEVIDDGNLEIALREGKMIQKKPHIYQMINGNKIEVDGKFKLLSNDVLVMNEPNKSPSPITGEGSGEGEFAYTFELASYDKDYPLIIDPTLVYSTYLGGSGFDSMNNTGGNKTAIAV